MIPEMKQVQSSNIESIGHDGADLHVRFKSGGHYSYSGVPANVHADMLTAPSKTKFLRSMVIGKYPHTKVN